MKQLTDKQKKAVWIVAAVLFAIHFAPAVFRSFTVFGAGRQVVLAPTRPASSAGNVQFTEPKPAVLTAAQQAAFLGTWRNEAISADGTRCTVHLELRPSTDEPGKVSGYEARSCININKMTLQPDITSTKALQDATPVATVMTGSPFEGSTTFKVENTVGSSPYVCPPTSYAVSPFGQRAIVAQWKGQKCPESQIVLVREGN